MEEGVYVLLKIKYSLDNTISVDLHQRSLKISTHDLTLEIVNAEFGLNANHKIIFMYIQSCLCLVHTELT